MWHPEKPDSLIAVMVRVNQENDVGLPNLFVRVRTFLWQRRGVYNNSRHIFRGTDSRRYSNLREDRLDLGGNKNILYQRPAQEC